LMDVDVIDLAGVGGSNGPAQGGGHDPVVKPFTLGGRHELRIPHAWNVPIGRKDDGRRDDRARETSPAHLVDAGYLAEADAPECVLQRPHSRDTHARGNLKPKKVPTYLLASAFCACSPPRMRAALPFRSRR